MGKINLFKALLSAVLLLCLSAQITSGPVFAAEKKAAPKQKSAKVRAGGLGLLTMAQVARLPDRMRREYIKVFREAVGDLEVHQNAFGRTYGKFESASSDLYASSPSQFLNWFLENAEAQAASEVAQGCIHGGNLSGYPAGARPTNAGGVRVIGRCEPITCQLSGRNNRTTRQDSNARGLSGYKCGFVATGLVNRPERGCMETSVIENARFTKKCDDRRQQLARENRAATETLLNETNEFFGFKPDGTYRADTCKSEGSKRLFNRLIDNSFDDDAFGMLIKAAYFCKSVGQGLPDGLRPFDGNDSPFSFEALEANFNGLTAAVDSIYAGYSNHCPSLIAGADRRDLERKCARFEATRSAPGVDDGQIPGIARGSDLYAQEANRCNKIRRVGSGPYRHDNVLEVEECSILYARRDALRQKVTDIAGTFPRLYNEAPPPNIPAAPPYEAVRVFPTGCTEAVTREGSKLAQASARVIPALEQTTQNLKDRRSRDPAVQRQAGAFRGSRKYRSLVSTMALACGDGLIYDSEVTVEMQVDYLHAFGYCSSEKYDWEAGPLTPEQDRLVMSWGSQRYWKGQDPKRDNPERRDQFKRIYGIEYDDAKDMFCGNSGRRGERRGRGYYTSSEKRDVLRARRESFERGRRKFGNGSDSNYSGALADCLTEASRNAADFHRDSGLCIGFESFTRGRTPAERSMRENFLDDCPVADFSNDGAIAKQMEEYRTQIVNGATVVCADSNQDMKDDSTGNPCNPGESFQCLSWVSPRDATPAGAEYQSYRCLPENPSQQVPTFKDVGNANLTARFTYRTGAACDIGSGEVQQAPAANRGGAQ